MSAINDLELPVTNIGQRTTCIAWRRSLELGLDATQDGGCKGWE